MALRSEFGSYNNITSATDTFVKKGRGMLVSLIVNKALATGVITIYDSQTASGNKIATITFPGTLLANQAVFPYLCKFTDGLTITTSAATDITVIYE